ncbi:ATP-binding protein [Paenibacillus chartarius]|uniref:histidine kinase n=1 Tax=Paenibacillus chartarius TaxID=747481 RepID=A0ABV6DN74_9BACL
MNLWSIYLIYSHWPLKIVVSPNEQGAWVITDFSLSSNVSPDGLKYGDQIVSVNGIDPGKYFSVIRWRSLDQVDSVDLIRSGTVPIHLDTTSSPSWIPEDVSPVVIELLCLAGAVLLIRALPRSLSARHLAYVFINISLAFLSFPASIRGDPFGKLLIHASVMVLPIVFLQFLIVLLNEKGGLKLTFKGKRVVWGAVSAIVALMSFYFFDSPYTNTIYNFVVSMVFAFFIVGLVVNLVFLFGIYWKHRRNRSHVSLMVSTIWFGMAVSFAPITFFSFLPDVLFGQEWVYSYYMSWFIFVLPVTFAYLIVAKKLYDMELIVRRIALVLFVSLLPSFVLALLYRLLLPAETSWRGTSVVFLMLLASFTFVLYSFEYFTTKLQPLLFPRKHQLQIALINISTKLQSISSFHDLKGIILVDIVSTLQVFGGAIVFKYDDEFETISEGAIDPREAEALVLADGEADQENYSLIKINRNEEYTSYLIISRKMTGTLLSTEELQWLKLITSYLAVSLENVYLIRKLTMKLGQLALQLPNEDAAKQLVWFRKMMFDLQERERTRIATDLHDTTMQDLFFLKQRLNALLEKYAFTANDRKQMDGLLDYIDIINVNLRQSCFELHPYMLKEIGLVHTVRRLVEFEAPVSPFEIGFRTGGAEFIEQQDLDTKRHIFRMIQELVNNAKKHSRATRIRLELYGSPSAIRIEYEDNGIGFDVKQMAVADIGTSGRGIDQIKSRIFSMNGKFELQTSTGTGVTFIVTIPIREGMTA